LKETTKTFLNILFNEGEYIYASPDKYTSKRLDDDSDWETYRPSIEQKDIDEEKTVLVAINPLKGDVRNDENVTAYRTFLVEIDDGLLAEQKKYIDESGLPYSLCVFSGNKSLHFAVTLDHDLPTLELYRMHAEWLLKTLPRADQLTKNPSRSIRFPGVKRPKGKLQALVESRGRISYDRLMAYLSRFPDAKPKPEKEEEFEGIPNNQYAMSKWVLKGLKEGFDMTKGRNQTWFSVGFEFGKGGYSLESTFEALEPLYTQEADFKEREWKMTVNNGHSKAVSKYWRNRG
jgi:hypothetical protein